MSQYLIDRIKATGKIEVLTQTEIVALYGSPEKQLAISPEDQVCARQEREKSCEAFEHSLGFELRRDQAGGRPRPAHTAQGGNDRRHHEGDWLAAALGPRLLCGRGAQEARLDADLGEGRGRTRLSRDCRPAVQIEAEDLRATGRLAMASVDTRAIEGEIDRIRSLGRTCGANGGGSPTLNRRGSVATCLSLHSVTDFRKSRIAGSARRPGESCKRWRRPCGQRGGPAPSLSLTPGARLVREWRGRTHTVTITEDGFEYAGTSYPSLTKIAKKITGAHWSGPRLFGLLGRCGAPGPCSLRAPRRRVARHCIKRLSRCRDVYPPVELLEPEAKRFSHKFLLNDTFAPAERVSIGRACYGSPRSSRPGFLCVRRRPFRLPRCRPRPAAEDSRPAARRPGG
jgi:Protein of unknown function (DUF2924)